MILPIVIGLALFLLCSGEQCPDGYTQMGNMCILMGKSTPWKIAQKACDDGGATLFVVRDPTQWDILKVAGPEKELTTIWVGLHYDKDTSTFHWSDGSVYDPKKDWAPWAEGQPNLSTGQCVVIKNYKKVLAWVMANCDAPMVGLCIKTMPTTYGTGTPFTIPTFLPISCPAGLFGFGGHCMKYNKDMVSFADASKSCADSNSYILFTREKKMWDYATYYMASQLPNFWIGIFYNKTIGNLQWSDGKTYDPGKDWAPWGPDQPGKPGQWAGDCVNTQQDFNSGQYSWIMADCQQALYGVCMLEMGIPSTPVASSARAIITTVTPTTARPVTSSTAMSTSTSSTTTAHKTSTSTSRSTTTTTRTTPTPMARSSTSTTASTHTSTKPVTSTRSSPSSRPSPSTSSIYSPSSSSSSSSSSSPSSSSESIASTHISTQSGTSSSATITSSPTTFTTAATLASSISPPMSSSTLSLALSTTLSPFTTLGSSPATTPFILSSTPSHSTLSSSLPETAGVVSLVVSMSVSTGTVQVSNVGTTVGATDPSSTQTAFSNMNGTTDSPGSTSVETGQPLTSSTTSQSSSTVTSIASPPHTSTVPSSSAALEISSTPSSSFSPAISTKNVATDDDVLETMGTPVARDVAQTSAAIVSNGQRTNTTEQGGESKNRLDSQRWPWYIPFAIGAGGFVFFCVVAAICACICKPAKPRMAIYPYYP